MITILVSSRKITGKITKTIILIAFTTHKLTSPHQHQKNKNHKKKKKADKNNYLISKIWRFLFLAHS